MWSKSNDIKSYFCRTVNVWDVLLHHNFRYVQCIFLAGQRQYSDREHKHNSVQWKWEFFYFLYLFHGPFADSSRDQLISTVYKQHRARHRMLEPYRRLKNALKKLQDEYLESKEHKNLLTRYTQMQHMIHEVGCFLFIKSIMI